MDNGIDGAVIDTKMDRQEDELLSLDEAAQFLGTSATTLYRLLKQNDLSGLKVGRQWRFRKGDLLTYLERAPGGAEVAQPEELAGETAFFYADAGVQNALASTALDAESEIKRLAYGILALAINAGASDIHLEPIQHAEEPCLLMRMRVAGILQEVRRMPITLHAPLVKLLKKMAGIDTAKTQPPLRGGFHLAVHPAGKNPHHRIGIAVSCLPTTRGEDIAIRLWVPPATVVSGLERMEMVEEQRAELRDWLHRRHGLIVATGLGQQKEFLYNCLLEIAAPERKAILLEEFPDHSLPWSASVPINRPGTATLPDTLRAVHNHDPNVIMVEATKDAETAQIIHELAFTEYLVLTAVPANQTAQAVRWLLEQQVEPLVVARTLLGIVAQWQARRLCEHCKEAGGLSASDPVFRRVQELAAQGGYALPRDATFYQARGCEQCHQGYKGRVDLFEVMTWGPALIDALLQGASAGELTQVALGQGMRSLLADGIWKAVEGKTSLNEVLLAGMATI